MSARMRLYPTGPAGVPDAAADAVIGICSEPGRIMVDTFIRPMLPNADADSAVGVVVEPLGAGRWWWATRDWSTFVQAAEASMPTTPYLTPDAPPSISGSLWLADPLRFTASDGIRQTVDVIAWRLLRFTTDSVVPAALVLSGLSAGHVDDETEAEVAAIIADAPPAQRAALDRMNLHLVATAMVAVVPPELAATPVPDVAKAAAVANGYDVPDSGWTYADAAAGLDQDTIGHPMTRFAVTAWALLGARATDTTDTRPDRKTRRRLERASMPTDPVRVVDVRRPTGSGAGTSADRRDWSHRWIVSGHWRRQWYPSEGVHRTIWIDAYPKGPADAPLLVRPTVHRPSVPGSTNTPEVG